MCTIGQSEKIFCKNYNFLQNYFLEMSLLSCLNQDSIRRGQLVLLKSPYFRMIWMSQLLKAVLKKLVHSVWTRSTLSTWKIVEWIFLWSSPLWSPFLHLIIRESNLLNSFSSRLDRRSLCGAFCVILSIRPDKSHSNWSPTCSMVACCDSPMISYFNWNPLPPTCWSASKPTTRWLVFKITPSRKSDTFFYFSEPEN